MHYREFLPNILLQPYVQCFFICETDTAVIAEDSVFATGFVEIMFNLGANGPEQIVNGGLVHEPSVQLWGQTIRPFTFTSFRKHAMLGIRFFPHTAACFFNEPIALFNDQVIDFHDVAGKAADLLYAQLMEAGCLEQRIALIERFLLARLSLFEHKFGKLKMVSNILQDLGRDDFFENIHSVAARYGISSRYLQKLFVSYSGLSPGLFSKIARFQQSVQLLTQKDLSLTIIAYRCGYYDQSHFIKDFRSFTGTAPSHFQPELSTDLFVHMNN
ncbi:MAG: Helix-turn-helix protein [Mucilaginibacter sp.]|nr:Helix-turn-helix protein [Mucilaginibacter sp.]